jgi:hypothetical protein
VLLAGCALWDNAWVMLSNIPAVSLTVPQVLLLLLLVALSVMCAGCRLRVPDMAAKTSSSNLPDR